jgi:hypothetical protein
LKELRCVEQEDYTGLDDLALSVYAPEAMRDPAKVITTRLGDGWGEKKVQPLSATVRLPVYPPNPNNASNGYRWDAIKMQLVEKDSADPDDFLGEASCLIRPSSFAERSVDIKYIDLGGDAEYILTYTLETA